MIGKSYINWIPIRTPKSTKKTINPFPTTIPNMKWTMQDHGLGRQRLEVGGHGNPKTLAHPATKILPYIVRGQSNMPLISESINN